MKHCKKNAHPSTKAEICTGHNSLATFKICLGQIWPPKGEFMSLITNVMQWCRPTKQLSCRVLNGITLGKDTRPNFKAYTWLNWLLLYYSTELEALEACYWLKAAGFPQYAQAYEGIITMNDLSSNHSISTSLSCTVVIGVHSVYQKALWRLKEMESNHVWAMNRLKIVFNFSQVDEKANKKAKVCHFFVGLSHLCSTTLYHSSFSLTDGNFTADAL